MRATIRQQSPFGNAIFCDDIRQETSGKLIYIGVYAPDIVFAEPFPQTLSKICVSISYKERPGDSDEPVTILIEGPTVEEDGAIFQADFPVNELRSIQIPTDEPLEDPFVMGQMLVTLAPITFKQAGRLRVYAQRGETVVSLGSLNAKYDPNISGQLR